MSRNTGLPSRPLISVGLKHTVAILQAFFCLLTSSNFDSRLLRPSRIRFISLPQASDPTERIYCSRSPRCEARSANTSNLCWIMNFLRHRQKNNLGGNRCNFPDALPPPLYYGGPTRSTVSGYTILGGAKGICDFAAHPSRKKRYHMDGMATRGFVTALSARTLQRSLGAGPESRVKLTGGPGSVLAAEFGVRPPVNSVLT